MDKTSDNQTQSPEDKAKADALAMAFAAMEYGYKACEKGHNLEMAREQFAKLMQA